MNLKEEKFMSTEVMGVLGFVLALAVLVVLVCKGMHLAYCAVITVLTIIVTNGTPSFPCKCK